MTHSSRSPPSGEFHPSELAPVPPYEAKAIRANIALLPIAHRLYLLDTCAVLCRAQQANIENRLAIQLRSTDAAASLAHANAGIALTRDLLQSNPNDISLMQTQGSIMAAGAGAYRVLATSNKLNLLPGIDCYPRDSRPRHPQRHRNPARPL